MEKNEELEKQNELAGYERQEGREFWMPEKEGDFIEGMIKEVSDGDFGRQYVIVKKDGKEITTPSHKVLQSRMRNAVAGNFVKIIMIGYEPAKKKGQNPTTLYEVGIKKK